MTNDLIQKYSDLDKFNVSRETCAQFEHLVLMILEKNKKKNLISKENANKNILRNRHIIDSAQIIDFIDLNYNTTCDIGSGNGMPGLVVAIMLKNMKKKIKMALYEKSYHKSIFLKEVSKELNLNTEIIQEDVFNINEARPGTVIARAFKPLPIMLELINKNFSKYKNLVLFMGKNGREVLKKTLERWELEYTEKKSLTNKESFLLNIKNAKKLY
jgi:16S rRNA (guanine527-N7)-methyltransferase